LNVFKHKIRRFQSRVKKYFEHVHLLKIKGLNESAWTPSVLRFLKCCLKGFPGDYGVQNGLGPEVLTKNRRKQPQSYDCNWPVVLLQRGDGVATGGANVSPPRQPTNDGQNAQRSKHGVRGRGGCFPLRAECSPVLIAFARTSAPLVVIDLAFWRGC